MTSHPLISKKMFLTFAVLPTILGCLSIPVHAQPFAYIPNSGDDTVSAIDTVTDSVVETIEVWDFCFDPTSSEAIFGFNRDNLWLQGGTEGGPCREGNPLIGWAYKGNWVIAQDAPTSSGCAETTFMWGDSAKNYDSIDSEGRTETGALAACTDADDLIAHSDATDKMDTIQTAATVYHCLTDGDGNQYDLTVSSKYIQGTVDHNRCGGGLPVTGMRKNGIFSLYVDIPSDSDDCNEGYLTVAWTDSKRGKWHNANDTLHGGIRFIGCDGPTLSEPPNGNTPGVKSLPVLMVHGFRGNGRDAWGNDLVPFLKSHGWENLYYPTMEVDNEVVCSQGHVPVVADWINGVLSNHPEEDVAIVAHSRGGLDVMQTLWQGMVDMRRIKYVIIISGIVNYDCGDIFPPHPADQTPGDTLYTTMYSDGLNDCDDVTKDGRTSAEVTYVEGADTKNLYPLCHDMVHKDLRALEWVLEALQGNLGGN